MQTQYLMQNHISGKYIKIPVGFGKDELNILFEVVGQQKQFQ